MNKIQFYLVFRKRFKNISHTFTWYGFVSWSFL